MEFDNSYRFALYPRAPDVGHQFLCHVTYLSVTLGPHLVHVLLYRSQLVLEISNEGHLLADRTGSVGSEHDQAAWMLTAGFHLSGSTSMYFETAFR